MKSSSSNAGHMRLSDAQMCTAIFIVGPLGVPQGSQFSPHLLFFSPPSSFRSAPVGVMCERLEQQDDFRVLCTMSLSQFSGPTRAEENTAVVIGNSLPLITSCHRARLG